MLTIAQNAIDAGVTKLLLPNIDLESINRMHQLVEAFPQNCYAMMGLHPCSVTENYKADLAQLKIHLDKGPYCAVGEIGIDLYWDKSTLKWQQEAFIEQVNWDKGEKLTDRYSCA